jgi:hypothetical protein
MMTMDKDQKKQLAQEIKILMSQYLTMHEELKTSAEPESLRSRIRENYERQQALRQQYFNQGE